MATAAAAGIRSHRQVASTSAATPCQSMPHATLRPGLRQRITLPRWTCRSAGGLPGPSSGDSVDDGELPASPSGPTAGPKQPQESLRASLERLFAGIEAPEPATPEPAAGLHFSASPASPFAPIKWPSVDWSRYNLQLLFVDRTGTIRSRMAAGIFERIAEWNGWSRALIPWSCGLHISSDQEQEGSQQGEDSSSMSRRAAVFTAGSSLGLFPGSLVKPADKFGLEDLDYYDLVLVLDRTLYGEVLSQVPPEQLDHYKKKVCLLTSFSDYESEGIVLATGGLALLPRALSGLLRPAFEESKQVVDVPSPNLTSENSQEELGAMVRPLILACGGLCKYLMDSFPETASNGGPHRY